MLPNVFIGKTKKPTSNELAAALGPTRKLWNQLVQSLAQELGVDIREWNSYSPKFGWALRLKRKKRTIVWLSPWRGCFGVMFILGDRAIKAVRQIKLPQRMVKVIDEAPRYPEGTGVRFGVKGPRDIAIVKKLAAIKLAN